MSDKLSKQMINILLIGESGVGKSSLINLFDNFFAFSSLDEAIQGEPRSPIPCSFTFNDINGEEHRVRYGQDDNEVHDVGEAATQQCRAYTLEFEQRLIRFIDTPGLGDPRGIEQDKENLENITQFISEYEYLHCICIVLKSTETRLGNQFHYVMDQLLGQLHCSASKNFIFIFTHAQASQFKPGEAAPILAKKINEYKTRNPGIDLRFDKSTKYCVDNGSYKYMMANKQGIVVDESDLDIYRMNWKKSSEMCIAMVKYIISDLTPHQVKDSVSVIAARRLITILSEPLAEITENINENIKIIEDHKVSIENIDNDFEFIV